MNYCLPVIVRFLILLFIINVGDFFKQSPKMNSNFHEIAETINLARVYIENLNSLKTEICSAQKQVVTTCEETQENIQQTFSNLKNRLSKILENREKALLKKAEQIRIDGLQPLQQCETVIETNIERTLSLVEEGVQIPQNDQERIIGFLEKASLVGNLPEVPESKEVPCISFYHEPITKVELESMFSGFGEVFRTAPIQIKSLTPKPGALIIEWQQTYENYDDRIKEIQKFKLQRAFGDVVSEKDITVNFIDCYTGTDSQYFLRDIQICQPYSFRVCCKFEGAAEWSPWSVPQVGSTTIPGFSWKRIDGVILSNENKIVALSSDTTKYVHSDGAQISMADSVEFIILEANPEVKMSIYLCVDTSEVLTSFMVHSNGKIFIDGTEKSTVLPNFTKGLKVCFSLERINTMKVRVNVDCKDKRVTYDWSVGECSHLYFASQLTSKWKIMVE